MPRLHTDNPETSGYLAMNVQKVSDNRLLLGPVVSKAVSLNGG